MTELEFKLLEGVQSLQSDMTDVKVTMAKNTETLEHHVKRTDELQDIVTPIFKDYLSRQAIEDYEKRKRESLVYKLKLPGYILGTITAIGTLLAWFMSK